MYMGKSKTLRPSCELFSTLEVTFMKTVWKGDGGKNTSSIPPELFLTPAVTVVWRILYGREQGNRLKDFLNASCMSTKFKCGFKCGET